MFVWDSAVVDFGWRKRDGWRWEAETGRGPLFPPGQTVLSRLGFGYYGGEWARWNNRTFESDSYNDWWHDQPWRAYPRWMTQNLGCDRRWYSASSTGCSRTQL